MKKKQTILILCSLLTAAAHAASLENVWIVGKEDLSAEQTRRISETSRLLVMIPGVSSGDTNAAGRFLDGIREKGGYELALFYDWETVNVGRKVVSQTATIPAARRLLSILAGSTNAVNPDRTIDTLAHSAGTVVANRMAIEATESGVALKLRHVLLLGTALSSDEPLTELKAATVRLVNLHSDNDKVNRNVNDREGLLESLDGGRYLNLRMDTTLSGRPMRHYEFLSDHPENRTPYAAFLSRGTWPEPRPDLPPDCGLEELHRFTGGMATSTTSVDEAAIRSLIANPNPDIRYYGVILAGLCRAAGTVPELKGLLEDAGTSTAIRKEVYQTLGALRDPELAGFLREITDHNPESAETLRDVLRALKRERIERP